MTYLTRAQPAPKAPGGTNEAGQGLVEFALVLPIFLLLLLIMFEFGFAYNHNLTLGLASREGARTGAGLASGSQTCAQIAGGARDAQVDANIIAGLQRILKSPGSDVVMTDISQVRIFKADATGAQVGGYVNVWTYTGPGTGPDVDPGPGTELLDFTQGAVAWPACSRDNTSATPDSIGVQIRYTYRLETPLAGLVSMLRGSQAVTISMNDQTVMVLNPTS